MTKKITGIKDPVGLLGGILDTLGNISKINYIRRDAITTELPAYTIDTTDTFDAGWETGIEPKGKKWIIVERYADEAEAKTGHAKWVRAVTENPAIELLDVNYEYEAEED